MNIPTKKRPSRILIAMVLCVALQMISFVMFLPLFARRFESFGSGIEALGMSAVAYGLTSTFAAPFVGTLADRFGRRPLILLSLAGYVLVFSGYLIAASTWLLILLRGLTGVFNAGLLPTMMSIIGDLAPENRRAQWAGIVGGGASAGWIGGPLLGGLLYDRFGYFVPFAASITMTACALLIAVFLIPETQPPEVKSRSAALSPVSWLTSAARPAFALLLLITFGVMFAWAFIEPQFIFYVYDDLSWTSSQLGLVMSAYGLAFMFGEFALGQLSDRLGRIPVLVLGLALFSFQFAGLLISRELTWIAASFILSGLGNALYDPTLSAMILDYASPEHTARMMGLKSMAGSLGTLLGPALVVLLAPIVRPQVVFLIATTLVFILTLVPGLVSRLPKTIEVADHFSQSVAE